MKAQRLPEPMHLLPLTRKNVYAGMYTFFKIRVHCALDLYRCPTYDQR